MKPGALDVDPTGQLEQLILLLDRAGRELHRAGAQAGTGSPPHWLAVGVFLAQARAVELLPKGHEVVDLTRVGELLDQTLDQILGVASAGEHSALQLLRAADQLTRSKALLDADWPGVSTLVVELCDLVREADRGGH